MSRVGIIGAGMLGAAMIRGWLNSGAVDAKNLVIGQRSKTDAWPDATVTSQIDELVGLADVLVLAVPPDAARAMQLNATGKLCISVMAGVTLTELDEICRGGRIVRAMTSPAAEFGLAFSPWHSRQELNENDSATVMRLLSAWGETAKVSDEDHIDRFTVLTGPVPGFPALFADTIVEHAKSAGIAEEVAMLAVRQLFLSAGKMMVVGKTPGEHAQEMLDYAGTTAEGMKKLKELGLYEIVHQGLNAAYDRTKTI